MIQKFLTPVLLLTCVVLNVGCSQTVFENPLVAPQDAKPIPNFHGQFQGKDGLAKQYGTVEIEAAGKGYPKGFVQIASVTNPHPLKHKILAFVAPVGEHFVLHLMVNKNVRKNGGVMSTKQSWNPDEIAGYWLYDLEIDKKSIGIRGINSRFIEKQINGKTIAGRVETKAGKPKSKTFVITESPKSLKNYLEKHFEKGLFAEKITWTRLQ